ncbi:trigger factor [Aciditerrimonas ferrireducens]|uniref:Trigger factor n=1 Tax=Aciditerrimonas ferrireducens TaxID=667306 RepID=A0ABV6C728_9ACTN
MRATAEPVEGNRVKLSIELDPAEVDRAVEATVRRLSRQVRVPGFRPGKVPRRVIESRLGGPLALREEAVSDLLPEVYAQAVAETAIDPIGAPEVDVRGLADAGPLTVDALVEVRPQVSVAGYQGLEVTLPGLSVDDEEVEEQLTRLRRQHGELRTADRPAIDGDFVTVDLHASREGADDLDVQDYVYELGSASALPELDEHLRGAKPGEVLTYEAELPEQGPMTVRVLVKEVQENVLPEATDEWAAEVSDKETLAELRADLRARLRRVKQARALALRRERALEALVALVAEEPPEVLVEQEIDERLHEFGHQLAGQGMTLEQLLQATGRDEAALRDELREEARRAVLADLALRALADAEGIEIDEAELDDAVAEAAGQLGLAPAELRQRLERTGRLAAVRSERRKAKALAWLEEHVALVDEDGNPLDRAVLEAGDPAAPSPDDEPGGEEPAGEGNDVEVEA